MTCERTSDWNVRSGTYLPLPEEKGSSTQLEAVMAQSRGLIALAGFLFLRLVACSFCENDFTAEILPDHSVRCGASTAPCPVCSARFTLASTIHPLRFRSLAWYHTHPIPGHQVSPPTPRRTPSDTRLCWAPEQECDVFMRIP